LRLVVAEHIDSEKVGIVGEMKAWAYARESGLQLDTMRVSSKAPKGVGHLVWAATMAWALESTPCKRARLLAICDEDQNHASLVRYFGKRGFSSVKEVGSAPFDLPLRLIWGGAGLLMVGNCKEIYRRSQSLWLKASLYSA